MALPFRRHIVFAAFARSRRNPVRRTLGHLNKYLMILDELLLWRFARADDPRTGILPLIEAHWARLSAMSDSKFDLDLSQHIVSAEALKQPDQLAFAVAQAAEAATRHFGFRPRHTQLGCALGLLRGDCIEMRTGEGKTLAAGLAALVAARAGMSTHVITVNDYLAGRDHDLLAPIAQRLGLSISVLRQDLSDDDKRKAYDVDLLYGTNKTFVFDHLRDRREARQNPRNVPRQMGQAFAIVDEADSVLIDDATVPMLLSEPAGTLPESDLRLFYDLCTFVQSLEPPLDRSLDSNGGWRLTPQGIARLADAAKAWVHSLVDTEDLIGLAESALSAFYNFRRGETYLVQDEKIVLIDQSTGRLMPDRRWGYGMHQFVEIKEGLSPSTENRTVGQITQQTFFRQYRILSGLTGTAHECRGEFWAVYRLPVQPIAPFTPPKLQDMGLHVCATHAEKNVHIMQRAIEMAKNRAVLVGVNDVLEATELAKLCRAHGQEVSVLDAEAEAQEAELVAAAGQVGRITIATHLAGRGTDIALQGDLRERGGLHVIIGSAMASGRLERQLYGRAGRQGDPGSYERVISLEDRGLTDGAQSVWRRLMTASLRAQISTSWCLSQIQAARDALARRSRKRALLAEQDLSRQLGYR